MLALLLVLGATGTSSWSTSAGPPRQMCPNPLLPILCPPTTTVKPPTPTTAKPSTSPTTAAKPSSTPTTKAAPPTTVASSHAVVSQPAQPGVVVPAGPSTLGAAGASIPSAALNQAPAPPEAAPQLAGSPTGDPTTTPSIPPRPTGGSSGVAVVGASQLTSSNHHATLRILLSVLVLAIAAVAAAQLPASRRRLAGDTQ